MKQNPLQRLIRLFLILTVVLLLAAGAASGVLTVYQRTKNESPVTADEANAVINKRLLDWFFLPEK